MPAVSIVMPAHNAGPYIAESIQSVLRQTFDDWELIIVDDDSCDDTDKEVARFLSDGRITFLRQKRGGPAVARNRAIRAASGDFIAFLDSDDLWLPDKLEKQLEQFRKHPDVGVCGTGMRVIDPEGTVIRDDAGSERCGAALPDLLAGRFTVPMSSAMIRREVLDRAGPFDEDVLLSEDFELWLRVALQCPFRIMAEPLLLYRVGHSNISGTRSDERREYVMRVIVPRFLGLPTASMYVLPRHVRELRSRCFKNRADEKAAWLPGVYWYVRSLMCRPLYVEAWEALAVRLLPRFVAERARSVARRRR